MERMSVYMNIGNKLRELRMEKGLTQEELADRAELSKGFISQIERDLTSPSIAISSPMTPMSRSYFLKKISLKKQMRSFSTPSNGSSRMHRRI